MHTETTILINNVDLYTCIYRSWTEAIILNSTPKTHLPSLSQNVKRIRALKMVPATIPSRFTPIRELSGCSSEGFNNDGIVLCYDQVTGGEAVEKRLSSWAVQSGSALSEIRILEQLDHPNVVRMLGYHLDKGKSIHASSSIWFEYCNNGALANVVEHYQAMSKPIPEAFLLACFRVYG